MAGSDNGTMVEVPVEPTPVEYLVSQSLLQTIVHVVASLPYNHPIGDGRVCGDLVNTLRALQPAAPVETDG